MVYDFGKGVGASEESRHTNAFDICHEYTKVDKSIREITFVNNKNFVSTHLTNYLPNLIGRMPFTLYMDLLCDIMCPKEV